MVRKCPRLYSAIDEYSQQVALYLVHLIGWNERDSLIGPGIVQTNTNLLYYG